MRLWDYFKRGVWFQNSMGYLIRIRKKSLYMYGCVDYPLTTLDVMKFIRVSSSTVKCLYILPQGNDYKSSSSHLDSNTIPSLSCNKNHTSVSIHCFPLTSRVYLAVTCLPFQPRIKSITIEIIIYSSLLVLWMSFWKFFKTLYFLAL